MNMLEQEIRSLIIEALNLEDITEADISSNMPLFGDGPDQGLGLDSIDALELGIALKKKYGVELETGDSRTREYFRDVSSLAKLVMHHGKIARNTTSEQISRTTS